MGRNRKKGKGANEAKATEAQPIETTEASTLNTQESNEEQKWEQVDLNTPVDVVGTNENNMI